MHVLHYMANLDSGFMCKSFKWWLADIGTLTIDQNLHLSPQDVQTETGVRAVQATPMKQRVRTVRRRGGVHNDLSTNCGRWWPNPNQLRWEEVWSIVAVFWLSELRFGVEPLGYCESTHICINWTSRALSYCNHRQGWYQHLRPTYVTATYVSKQRIIPSARELGYSQQNFDLRS